MAYRMTDFGSAESERLIQSVSAQLFAVQSSLERVKKLLDAGHFDDGFREAQRAEELVQIADRCIRQHNLTSFNAGLNVAKAQVTRMWSRFDAQATGRAALRSPQFSGAIEDIASYKQKGQQLISAGKDVLHEGQAAYSEAKDLWNEGKALFGASGPPDGMPITLPSCNPPGVSRTPLQFSIDVAFGIPTCPTGATPGLVTFLVGDSPGAIRAKFAAANAGFVRSPGTPAPKKTPGPLPGTKTVRAPSSSVLSSIPLSVWLGGGLLAVKLLMK